MIVTLSAAFSSFLGLFSLGASREYKVSFKLSAQDPQERLRTVPSLEGWLPEDSLGRKQGLYFNAAGKLAVTCESDSGFWVYILVLMNFVENIGCFCLTGWNFSWECFLRREQIDNLKKEQWYLHFRIILWHLLGIDYNTHCSLDNYKFTLKKDPDSLLLLPHPILLCKLQVTCLLLRGRLWGFKGKKRVGADGLNPRERSQLGCGVGRGARSLLSALRRGL